MDMQNVSNLQIPEGEVRTIHDKDGKLLWGKLSYDTKYKGDTTQQTYSGKNLVNFTTIGFSNANNGTGTRDGGTFTVTGTGINSGIQFNQVSLSLEPNTTYTFSAKVESTTSSVGSAVYIATNMESTGSGIFGNHAKAGEISSATFTTPSTIPSNASIRLYTREADATVVFADLQIEKGSTATDYEPYVGGIASPNPAYPQTVNVVTGTQTITLSDGIISDDYTVGLGTIELCKIGTYQDYIYKSGDDWYVHKECGKITYNGTENWGYNSAYSRTSIALASNMLAYATEGYCTHLSIGNTGAASANNVFNIGGLNLYVKATSVATSKAAWEAWLTSNNITVYYQLATPTDTQITDTALIAQLNNIHQFLTRYGYNSNVSGNLPIVIDKTDLS